MEFIEMLKADERFLYVLLTLSQEKNIKTGRFPLIYADECVISHTNETEFNEFLGNKKSEALHDRMIMVRIPYNLKGVWLFHCDASNPSIPVSHRALSCNQSFPPESSRNGGRAVGISENLAW
jgi:hypothetical protein